MYSGIGQSVRFDQCLMSNNQSHRSVAKKSTKDNQNPVMVTVIKNYSIYSWNFGYLQNKSNMLGNNIGIAPPS